MPFPERYQILRPLSKGGMGETFLVADRSQAESLAVLKKVPKKKAEAETIEALRREFTTLTKLSHPNIARVTQFGEDGDSYFFLEEYVDGGDIFAAVHEGNYNQILAALAQLLRALNYLHHQGWVHGDLKAENILVVKNASLFTPDAVKLIDFGLARRLQEMKAETIPAGTLHFMAPETLLERPADHRADLYALGVCLYRLGTGRYPFAYAENDIRHLVQAQINDLPLEPQRFRTDLPPALNEITMKLLSKDPERRFQSAADVLGALNEREGESFPFTTDLEWRLSLHDGPFLPRKAELAEMEMHYRGGKRRLVLNGEAGSGKTRLAKEFRFRLQLAGEDDSEVTIEEARSSVTPSGAIAVSPWSQNEIEAFLKDRLRLDEIPQAWKGIFAEACQGNPRKLVLFLEFWIAEGKIVIQRDQIQLKKPPASDQIDFESVVHQKISALEKDKRGILELCAFAQQPLSSGLLAQITGQDLPRIESLLNSLEKERWIRRVLFNGSYQYQIEEGKALDFLKPRLAGKSLPALLKLIEETHHAGKHVPAQVTLDSLLSTLGGREETFSIEEQIQLFATASLVYLETGDLEKARHYCEKFLKIPRLPVYENARILNRLGWIEYRRGNYPAALKIFQEAAALWEKTNDASGKASAANFQAITYQALPDYEKAQACYRKALALLEASDPWRPIIRTNLAACYQLSEDFSAALAEFGIAQEEAAAGKDASLQASLMNNLANLHLYVGRLDEARRNAHASLKLALENGMAALEGQNYIALASVADKEGNLEEYFQFTEKAVTLFERVGTATEQAQANLFQAYYYFTKGEAPRVNEILAEIRGRFPEEGQILAQCDLLAGKISAREEPPDVAGGEARLQEALCYYESRKDHANLWEVHEALGTLYQEADSGRAREHYQKALVILEALAKKVPEKYRESFFRDRKRERILADLSPLGNSSPQTEASPMKTDSFAELAHINRLLASGHNLNFLLETILEESLALLRAERGFILLWEEGDFRIKASRNMDRQTLESGEERYSTTISREAALKGQTILVTNASEDTRFSLADSVMGLRLHAVLAVPMKIASEVVGVIYLDNRFRGDAFNTANQKLLETFADQAALAIRNARQIDALQASEKKLAASMTQIEELNKLLQERLEKREFDFLELHEKYQAQQDEIRLRYSYDQIVGRGQKIKEVLKTLDRVTDSDVSVLITGESGTGKELIARALHYNSSRKEFPFIAENCSAFSETLLESELFGHVKGSFTGAQADRKGIFEVARGGTVFLDEIGEMPLAMQPKLLRVLQERQVRPVGGKEYRKVEVRVVAATNQDLEKLVKEGKFREDLFYRVNVVRIKLPSLRERREDIPLLVERFLQAYGTSNGKNIKVSPKAMDLLLSYDWPGNIRELANEIQRCCALSLKLVTPDIISENIRLKKTAKPKAGSLDRQLKEMEKAVILETLKENAFSKIKTAKILGISRITLYKKIKTYQIKTKEPLELA